MSEKTVYAIASGKGGVGKTTTTVNLGTALAKAGKRVAIVDVDLGMANLGGFVNLDAETTTLHDVLAGSASVEEATYPLADNLVALPSGNGLEGYAETSIEGLKNVVNTLQSTVEYVFLDVGAGVSHETVLPLGLAESVILISTPEPTAVQDVTKTIELTERAGGAAEGLVVTRTRPDDIVSAEEIATELAVPLLGAIPEDNAVRKSVYAGKPTVVAETESAAALAYEQLAAEIGGFEAPDREGPTTDSEDDKDQDDDDDLTLELDLDFEEDEDASKSNGNADGQAASHSDVSSAITEAESETE